MGVILGRMDWTSRFIVLLASPKMITAGKTGCINLFKNSQHIVIGYQHSATR